MSLALADSLIAYPDFNLADLMTRFVSWYQDGRYSCTGTCFDIGITTEQALRAFIRTGNPFAGSTDPNTAGNGSIMRLAPVAVRYWRDHHELLRVARDQSRTTHAAEAAIVSCEMLAELLASAIAGQPLQELLVGAAARSIHAFQPGQPRDEVRGSGYVVASLHAALWAVSRTSSFRNAILLAANLGEDADTTAAIAGQIAGAVYGLSGIPNDWLDRLAWRETIEHQAERLFKVGMAVAQAKDAA
jgi:ADP-ribosyl-[dinitrogen reductase] hydrolase